MSQIQIKNLTFGYDGSYDNIFENVNFQIDTNWKLGFIGRNGKGKTTFFNLLLGKYEYKGKISSGVNFEYFPFHVEDTKINAIDIVENIIPNYEYWMLSKELNLLETSDEILYRPFYTLSNGEQTKLLLAVLFLKENSFLLIDEPTNHLDKKGRDIISKYLNQKKGFILISHDRKFLDNSVDHIISINQNNIEVQQGNFSSWLVNKEREDNFELERNKKLKSEINRLKFSSSEKNTWSNRVESSKSGKNKNDKSGKIDRGYIGAKSAKMMKRSKCIQNRQEEAIKEKSKLLKNIEKTETLKINQQDFYTKKLISLSDVSIFYDNKKVCENIGFDIELGDRIALCGKNGSGKSSIIKLICGESISFDGYFKKNEQLKISYVSQDTTYLKGNLSDYAYKNSIDESLFKSILKKLNFSKIQFEKNIQDFSDGQKKKVLIAKSLCEKANLYIWDEPLNFIDIISRIQIEELLLQYKPTMLFVEHDEIFCNKISNKQIIL